MNKLNLILLRELNRTACPGRSIKPVMFVALLIALSFHSLTGRSQTRLSADQLAGIKAQAENGRAEEQWMLGHFYYHGDRGLEKNLQIATEWYRKAAVQGHPRAQLHLGKLYQHGESVGQDFKEAFRWYSRAAESGDADGQYALAHMFLTGKGVATNQVQALNWFKRAAFQQHSAAQGWCGYFYVNGVGVPQDYVEAFAWHNLSAANDPSNPRLREFRDQISNLMTKEQIAEGQKRTSALQVQIQAAIAQKKHEAGTSGVSINQADNSQQ